MKATNATVSITITVAFVAFMQAAQDEGEHRWNRLRAPATTKSSVHAKRVIMRNRRAACKGVSPESQCDRRTARAAVADTPIPSPAIADASAKKNRPSRGGPIDHAAATGAAAGIRSGA